jgi:hypothetical protein
MQTQPEIDEDVVLAMLRSANRHSANHRNATAHLKTKQPEATVVSDGTIGANPDTVPISSEVVEWPDPVPFLTRYTPQLSPDLLPGFLGEMAAATARH